MTDQEKLEKRIERACDADARSRMNAADIVKCSLTLGEILDTIRP
jgi:hypothetical protein